MAQKDYTLSDKFESIEDIIGADFSSDVTYYIQNKGPNILVGLESATEPTDYKNHGKFCPVMKELTHKKDGTDVLYIRSLLGTCDINITYATVEAGE